MQIASPTHGLFFLPQFDWHTLQGIKQHWLERSSDKAIKIWLVWEQFPAFYQTSDNLSTPTPRWTDFNVFVPAIVCRMCFKAVYRANRLAKYGSSVSILKRRDIFPVIWSMSRLVHILQLMDVLISSLLTLRWGRNHVTVSKPKWCKIFFKLMPEIMTWISWIGKQT